MAPMRLTGALGALPCTEGQVRVRALEHGDAAAFARGSRDESVKRLGHLPLPEYTEDIVREQIDGVIADGLADGSLAVLAIADARSDDFLGSIVLFNVREERAEVGFWLAPWGRGRGAAREALCAAARLAAHLGLDFLDARAAPENEASRRTLLGAGYRQVCEPQTVTAPSGAAFTALMFERRVVEFRLTCSVARPGSPGVALKKLTILDAAMTTLFSEADVLEVLGWAADLGVDAWLDGGWGVDALIGRQTRSHGDLDLVIEARHEHAFMKRLRERGFEHVPMWYTTDAHSVWRDTAGRMVDLHLIVIDEKGNGAYGDEGSYPAIGLAGTGAVGGMAVRCLSPKIQVEFHRGYEIRPQDRHDVGLLCEKFGIPLPGEYQR